MKKLFAMILVIAMLVSLVGCGGSSAPAATEAPKADAPAATQAAEKPAADPIVLKYNLIVTEEDAQSVGARKFKEVVEELSGGQITVQLYYNSTLYTQDGAFPALMSGELEVTNISIQQISEIVPSMAMFASTYFFKDYDHMRAMVASDVGAEINKTIEEQVKIIPLAYYYNGARQLNLKTDKEIMTPEDMKGIVLRMPESAAWIAAGEALGASVTALSRSEVYTALQYGTIDAQDNPMSGTYDSKYYEVTNQMSLTYHIIDFAPISICEKVWNQLNDEQKGWLYQAAEAGAAEIDAIQLQREAEMISFFEGEGLKIVYPDVAAFKAYAENYYKSNGLMDDWDMDVYAKVQALAG